MPVLMVSFINLPENPSIGVDINV